MAVSVLVPKLADDDSGGVLAAWFCDEGAEVSAGDLIASLERDHVTFDIEAECDGVLYRGLAVGDRGFVGDLVAYIVPAGDVAHPIPAIEDAPAAEPVTASPREPIPFPGGAHPLNDSVAADSAARWETATGESDRPFAWSTGESQAYPAPDEPDDAWTPPAAPSAEADDAGKSDAMTTVDELAWGLLTPEDAAAGDDDEQDVVAGEGPGGVTFEAQPVAAPADAVEPDDAPVTDGATFEGFAFGDAFGDEGEFDAVDEAVEEHVYDVPVEMSPPKAEHDTAPAFLSVFEEEVDLSQDTENPDEAWEAAVSFLDEVSPEDEDETVEVESETEIQNLAGDYAVENGDTGLAARDGPAWPMPAALDESIPEDEDAYPAEETDEREDVTADGDHWLSEPAAWHDHEAEGPAPVEVPFVLTPAVRNMRVDVDLTAAVDAFGGEPGRSAEDVVVRAVSIALAEYDGFEAVGDAVEVVIAGEEPVPDLDDRPTTCRVTSFVPYGIHAVDAPVPDGHPIAFAMGAARETVAFHDKSLVPVRVVTVSLGYDPGAVSDADAATLLARVRELLEAPGDVMAA